MAEENEFVPYKDISEVKKELEGMKGKKDISAKELYDAVERLSNIMTGMLEVFGAAAEQMKIEESEYDSSARKHEAIVSKLDKVIDQNKTIAEGMVAIVEIVKEKFVAPAREKEEMFMPKKEQMFKPKQEPLAFEPKPFMRQGWQPAQEVMAPKEPIGLRQPAMAPPPMSPLMPPIAPIPSAPTDFSQMPPMQPTPSPDLDLDLGFEEGTEPKKKGLFGMFKK